MNQNVSKRLAVAAMLGLLMWPSTNRAAAMSLVVTNYSFETPVLGDGNFIFGATGWTALGSSGTYDPPASQYSAVSDGVQIGFTIGTGDGFQQDLLASLNPGGLNLLKPGSYALTVGVGNRSGQTMGTYSIQFMTTDNTVLASATGNAESQTANGTFTDIVIPYFASISDPNLGKQLRILMTDTGGGQADFDNVRLSFVPEPSALWLLILGGTLLTLRRHFGLSPKQ